MLEPGSFLADRYEIIEKIGAGGMSDVYKAKDHVLSRDVAIKVLKAEFAEDMTFVSKFRTEAQSAAGLEHPNIVNIYDVGSEDGLYYIVMECVEGITLKTYIEKKGRLNYKESISIAIQVGRGIEAAHNKGIIHRDIKPQNIIISKEGKVKVTDFGIARAASGNTVNADVMGSVHYFSPEQARNGYSNEQSDIYSLGIVMYEMVTGRVPFDGETAVAVALQHLQNEMVPPSQIAPETPVALEGIIKKATQKSMDKRYSNMDELLSDLKKALVSPDEDIVTPGKADDIDKTRIITEAEIQKLHKEANAIPESTPVRKERVERRREEEDDDDDDDSEDEVNQKMDKIFTGLMIGAGVIIAIILIYIAGSFFGLFHFGDKSGKDKEEETEQTTEDEKNDQIEVPKLLGMTEDEAQEALKKLNLGYKNIGSASSDEYEEDLIISQTPVPGEKVDKNTTIKVTISSGKGEVEIPKVTGKSESEATRTLTSAGFKVNNEYEYSSTVQQGQVISQSPEGGRFGKNGDVITIVISQGTETVKVPDVLGKTEAEAKAALEGAGFSVTTSPQNSDSVEKGKVISQGTSAGSFSEKGSSISLVISAGAKEVLYHFSGKVSDYVTLEEGATAAYELLDAEGETAASGSSINSTSTISANNIRTSSGHLTITAQDGTVLYDSSVTFTQQ